MLDISIATIANSFLFYQLKTWGPHLAGFFLGGYQTALGFNQQDMGWDMFVVPSGYFT